MTERNRPRQIVQRAIARLPGAAGSLHGISAQPDTFLAFHSPYHHALDIVLQAALGND